MHGTRSSEGRHTGAVHVVGCSCGHIRCCRWSKRTSRREVKSWRKEGGVGCETLASRPSLTWGFTRDSVLGIFRLWEKSDHIWAWTRRGAVNAALVTLVLRLVSSDHCQVCSSYAYQTAQGTAKKRYVLSVNVVSNQYSIFVSQPSRQTHARLNS